MMLPVTMTPPARVSHFSFMLALPSPFLSTGAWPPARSLTALPDRALFTSRTGRMSVKSSIKSLSENKQIAESIKKSEIKRLSE
ncbi:hypothetical protein BN439_0263 [Erwinia amylovora Ea644]|nr:hypothetical protein BN439_0263 [Erwinia amylovora Ea644]CCP05346.1 hypothetical protein BN440_0291 [Erwinia amylovora MR1]